MRVCGNVLCVFVCDVGSLSLSLSLSLCLCVGVLVCVTVRVRLCVRGWVVVCLSVCLIG